jgi:alkylresorcinol/alkylpyrone synthase
MRTTSGDRAPSTVAAVQVALPPYRYPQHEVTEMLADLCLPPGADRTRFRHLSESAGVATRHLALPREGYAALGDFGRANDTWIEAAGALGEEAIAGALKQAGLEPADLDLIVCVSVTGIAVPSLDARLAPRMGMRPDVARMPLFGLGCMAGAAGVARVHDYLRGRPDGAAVLLAVELCSLTVQSGDDSAANLVAGALFGDGAAAVVMLGAEHPAAGAAHGPHVVASRSMLYPDTEYVMGWDIRATGFRVVLSPDAPDLIRAHLPGTVREFLAEHGLAPADIATWVCHPGGPKIIQAVTESLDLADDALAATRASLAQVGNLSSASVLHVLQEIRDADRPPPGSWGLMTAFGPGFCAEMVLLRW